MMALLYVENCMILASTVFEILAAQRPKIANLAYRDLETRVRGHSRSLILVPMESACTYSYMWSIASLVLSCTVSELWRLKVRKSPILHTPPSFNAPALGEPPEFRDETCSRKTRGMGLPYGENFIILTSTVFLRYTRLTDGRTDGR